MSGTPGLVLGLDLGANSVGWALVRGRFGPGRSFVPEGLAGLGVRVFPEGVAGDFRGGAVEGRNRVRREARGRRRMLEHRTRRLGLVFRLLQRQGLLPGEAATTGAERHRLLQALDARLCRQGAGGEPDPSWIPAMLPYRLRGQAESRPLSAHELGRVLFHLARRRGWGNLDREMAPGLGRELDPAEPRLWAGEEPEVPTPGRLLAGLDLSRERLRGRVFPREALRREFDRIWDFQAPHHPQALTGEFRARLARAIFFQRPPGRSRVRAGRCSLEPGRERTPWSDPLAQRFRLLHGVNDLRLLLPGGDRRGLHPGERRLLVDRLERGGDASFEEIRRLLGVCGRTGFNLEATGRTGLEGDRAAQVLAPVFGDRWADMPPGDRARVVEDLRSIRSPAALSSRAQRVWGLDPEQAARLTGTRLESGCCALSRKALRRLLPHLEAGTALSAAMALEYPERGRARAMDGLPPVFLALGDCGNPVVSRALGEMRKVVNALIRAVGRPDLIRVELAREMKQSAAARRKEGERGAGLRREREEAARVVRAFRGQGRPGGEAAWTPSAREVEKVLLARECGWTCPYTGRPISPEALLGPDPGFEVEHILPFSRSLDDSFANKTLCLRQENRERKGPRTPAEAYGQDPARYAGILERVRGFTSGPEVRGAKLRRFLGGEARTPEGEGADPVAGQGARRLLADTAHASRLARRYLGLLYGPEAPVRVLPGYGRATARLRRAWGLDRILGAGGKNRTDHRQHALDAVVVALCDRDRLGLASGGGPGQETARPWPGFLEEVRGQVLACLPSHRVSRKARGALHQESRYGWRQAPGTSGPCATLRQPLHALSERDLGSPDSVPDPAVRQALVQAWEARGGRPPRVAFACPEHLPEVRLGQGPGVTMRRLRAARSVPLTVIGRTPYARRVHLAANHHLAVFEVLERGKTRWKARVATLLEAMERKRERRPIVDREGMPGGRFLFSLAQSEVLEVEVGGRVERLRLRTFYPDPAGGARLELVRLSDARRQRDVGRKTRENGWFKFSVGQLGGLACRKVRLTPLGRVVPAND